MAELYNTQAVQKVYWDRKTYAYYEDHIDALKGSRYLYIGNLSFFTTEAQIYELFSKVDSFRADPPRAYPPTTPREDGCVGSKEV